MIRRKKFAVIGDQAVNVTQRAICQQLADNIIFRRKVAPHRLHTEPLRASRRLLQRFALMRIERQRLFDEHMFPRLQRAQAVREMVVMRRSDIDRVDVIACQQGINAAARMGNRPFVSERLRLVNATR